LSGLYLDANIFIYSLEAIEPWATLLQDVFSGLITEELSAVSSSLTLAECLVLPFKQNKNSLVKVYREALLSNHHLTIAPITDQILISAANIRAQSGLKLPDAIHAATALTSQCTAVLTNDSGFNRVSGINLFLLKDWIGSH
jgi:predicted nucleic acid-binding protein